jgi:hypothetical protein
MAGVKARMHMKEEERAGLAAQFRAEAARTYRKADELKAWGRSRKVIPLR